MYSMIDEAIAGQNISAKAIFQMPIDTDFNNSIISYELVDDQGILYVSGSEDSLTTRTISEHIKELEVSSLISIPSNIPTNAKGQKYILKWTLTIDSGKSFFNEAFSIFPTITTDDGPVDVVELANTSVTLMAVLPEASATVRIFLDNTEVHSAALTSSGPSAIGEVFEHTFPLAGSAMIPSLSSYTVTWEYTPPSSSRKEREVSRLYVVTSSILNAMKELQTNLNRVGRARNIEDVTFTAAELIEYLRMGNDKFNATGLITSFSMTNSKGSIRHFWNVCSQVVALRSRYLEEGEKAFDFSGQTVSLSVDITQYLDSLANQLDGWLDSNLPNFKNQLHKKGIISGPGDATGTDQSRVTGAIGISLGPVSNAGRWPL